MSHASLKGFPVVVPFPVHWSEMDAYGHVNNARTFTWFESARIAYMARIGLVGPSAAGADMTPTQGIGPILANTHADYLRPVVYPVNLVAGARVTKVGNSSITFEHAVAGADDGVLYTRGGSVVVTLRYATHEKVPVPRALRDAIEALEGSLVKGPDSGMALGVFLGILFLLVVGAGLGFGVAVLIKKVFKLSMPVAVGLGGLLVVGGGVGLFAVVFDDLTATWWAARTAKAVHFTVAKGFNGHLHLIFDANAPAVSEVNGKLEVPVGGARVLKVKSGLGIENDYADFTAHDTEGQPVEVYLDSSGSQQGVEYRGFWLGDQQGRTFGDPPPLLPE